ncbi:M23 family metallopeptidase [Cohaesibacter gelatinilyticus]|uniref:Murein DD-endopeptidase MepM and murein hydrolase activator NlpD, contain LysM domain n=1 Tax=Cohaesibacter gelatinilyticus TaxID=372072 RepID=A0A285PD63_9HYPH|nr:M23 family metallopeptidase [Cohaesibacter gelatinilyticus]SNZ19690.1 Murein DD-endopeptidase MepM and murein hydrolase activator NlpD, contain LysM domain [Cohaesibacter gelatinilyticus]HAT86898.1 M23 family peptidase [Hyphomicrobiales bacterium]
MSQSNKTAPNQRPIQLGSLPALLTPSARLNPPDRRTLNMRWLIGTVLTGCTSIFLMGGALVAGIQSQDQMAELATYNEQAANAASIPPGQLISAGRKSDRLSRTIRPVSHRKEIKVSTISALGNENLISSRPYMLISASLETKRNNDISLPEFDAVRIFASASQNSTQDRSSIDEDSIYSADIEGEMRIRSEPLNLASAYALEAGGPNDFVIQKLINQSSILLADEGNTTSNPFDLIDPSRFEFPGASLGNVSDAYIRVIPENMASITKTALDSAGAETEEKIVIAVRGDTVRDLLLENEATEGEAEELANLFSSEAGISELSNHQRLRIVYQLVGDGIRERAPLRISLYDGEEHQLTLAQSDLGSFQVADEPQQGFATLPANVNSLESLRSGPRLNIYNSLYQTALKNGIDAEMIDKMVQILSFDIDFKTRVKPGDSLQVFHSIPGDGSTDQPEILFLEIQIGGKTKRYYRYRTGDDNYVDYYDENGRSAKKFLMRKPMQGGKFRSPFGWRRHPILKISRLHKGVDWSAPRGTPIMASGNGRIVKRKWSSGYGKYIQIQHTNGYATGYAHMSAFSNKFQTGDYVRQGQIIGYVGSTGLSTGAHLHYEVTVNGRHVDPMRIRLPRGRTLKGEMLASFQGNRERIDELLGKPKPTRVAKAN